MASKSPFDRAIRQLELVPPEALGRAHALVIGVGAIGRHFALQLAALGVPRMSLFDDDIVAIENLAPQGYWPEDLGVAKATVTGQLCKRIFSEIELTIEPEKFRRSSARRYQSVPNLAVFFCVDSIATRRIIWQAVRGCAELVVDGRMSAEVIRVLAVRPSVLNGGYDATLFDGSEA